MLFTAYNILGSQTVLKNKRTDERTFSVFFNRVIIQRKTKKAAQMQLREGLIIDHQIYLSVVPIKHLFPRIYGRH